MEREKDIDRESERGKTRKEERILYKHQWGRDMI
jgi:hypothetical protein